MSATSRIEAMVQARAAARSRTMRAAILCAIAAALAGSALLGLSGWFLTGAGLAGLAGTAAARTVSSMPAGSPAWNPQATLALVTTSKIAASSPMRQAPKLSPRSLLMSIWSPQNRVFSTV